MSPHSKFIPTKVQNCFVTSEPFTEKLCIENTDYVFVFGDNESRYGRGGQAVIRFCANALGLPTKKSPYEYWSDDEFEHNKSVIDVSIKAIQSWMKPPYNRKIVFSSNGYGNGLAELPKRAPNTYEYLIHQLNTNFGTKYV